MVPMRGPLPPAVPLNAPPLLPPVLPDDDECRPCTRGPAGVRDWRAASSSTKSGLISVRKYSVTASITPNT